MKNKWLKRIAAVGLIFTLLLAQCVTSFADEGTPNIIISGDGVYEVETGKTTNIKLQVKNKGMGTAHHVHLEAKGDSGIVPYSLSLRNSEIGSLGVNSYAEATLSVKMDNTVKEASYSVSIHYTYSDGDDTSHSGSDTIYLKVKGFDLEPSFQFEKMQLVPEDLSPGEQAVLSGTLVNHGAQKMRQVELSLDNLASDGISLVGGFGTKMVAEIPVGGEVPFSFPLVCAADMDAGNYPVSVKLKYKDESGEQFEKTQQYYVNVGGIAGRKAELEIRNMQEPGGTFGVNENFTITFELYNKGEKTAKDIVVSAEALNASAVVPKSSGVKTVNELAVGASKSLSFTFAGTSESESQNYAIQFTVEYTSGGTAKTSFKQYAGVNVYNPDSEDDQKSKPKIIVSKYQSDPLIVMAGEEFDLTMTLLNTHSRKAVENIKMFLTLAEETSSDDKKSGNIFTPVNSSNTFYFDAISPKGTVEKSLRLYVVPEAQPKTYTLTVNFEYEDEKGTEYTAQELLGINVKQVTDLQIDEFAVPDMVEQFQPISVSFSYYNTGKVTLNNLMIKVEGDVDCSNRSTYIGNMESGNSDYYETTFTPNMTGEVPVSIVITYEDPGGEEIEDRRDFVLNVSEPYIPEDMEMPEENTSFVKNLPAAIIVLLLTAAGLVLFVKKQKEDPKSTAESVSDVEEIEDDDIEDDFTDDLDDSDEIDGAEQSEEGDKEGMPL